ncbi:multi-sensor signal transducation histidine kinase [Haloferula helveola]|uniref:histidine kinase n=2 Tax=Haloferula helveola TaxID=490095 RepID=A0ABM7REH9_9BACT|nr:multi-sensor signal transducation histidine kinase [Haloferula helveola]
MASGREKQIWESYRRLVKQVPLGVIVADPNDDYEFQFVNDNMLSILGYENSRTSLASLKREKVSHITEILYTRTGSPVEAKLRELGAKKKSEFSALVFCRPNMRISDVKVTATIGTWNNKTSAFFFIRNVTKELREEKELRLKNSELESVAYAFSHDLNAPLITLSSFLPIAIEHLEKASKERESLKLIEKARVELDRCKRASDRMQEMFESITELYRIGNGKEKRIDLEVVNAIENVEDILKEKIEESGATITCEGISQTLRVARSHVILILQNLISNAIKYRDPKQSPNIEIGLSEDHANIRHSVFYVADNGVGIPEHNKSKVFMMFQKLRSNDEGMGVGLAIVSRIVSLYQGKIWVEDNSPQGSVFYFTLPEAQKLIADDEGI